MKPKLRQSSMQKSFNVSAMQEGYNNQLEWLAYIGQPMLYDGELYVLRRNLEPGIDTLRWYKGIRVV